MIWALVQCIAEGWTLGVGFFIFALIAVNLVYFTRGLPMKYLLPGLMFLLVFQLFTMVLTGYSSFTNYGTGHLGSKDDAISALLAREEQPVADSALYPVVPIEKGGTVSMLVTFPEGTDQAGQSFIGTPESLTPVPPDQFQTSGDKVTGVAGYQSLNLGTLSANPEFTAQWAELRVPLNDASGHLPEVIEHLRGQGVQVRLRLRRGRGHFDRHEHRGRLHAERHGQLRLP